MALSLYLAYPLSEMEQAPFTFHLTGSRFFGTESPNSDWDFFVEFHPGLRVWLEARGFYQESDSDYQDSVDISEVWRHASGRVHVQIVSDVRRKAAVQEFLRDSGYGYQMYHMPKEYRRNYWKLAHDLFARTGRGQGSLSATH